jgi:hypothetical protein
MAARRLGDIAAACAHRAAAARIGVAPGCVGAASTTAAAAQNGCSWERSISVAANGGGNNRHRKMAASGVAKIVSISKKVAKNNRRR